MIFGDGVRLVLNNLKRRKGRTFLTALGVAIGTAAIVAMIALALGLKANAMHSFDNMGDVTTLEIWPGYSEEPGAEEKKLTSSTVQQLGQIPGVAGILASNRLYSDMEIKMGRKVGDGGLLGVEVAEAQSFPFKFDEGRFLRGKGEAVITYSVPESMREKKRKSRNNKEEDYYYGPEQDGVSQRVNMLNKSLTLTLRKYNGEDGIEQREYKVKVVGVLSQSEGEHGNMIYLPIETVNDMRKWLGQGQSEGRNRGQATYDSIKVKAASRDQVEAIGAEIKNLGYEFWSPAESLKEINQFFMIIQLVLGGIGAISLLVASIGIMNTMFMSILERTREIGIMKVLGASIPDIRRLFLMESGLIGLLGGLSGLLLALGLVGIVNAIAGGRIPDFSEKMAIVPLWLALFALGFSIFIGVISGLLPAQRAAKISPLQAIRQE